MGRGYERVLFSFYGKKVAWNLERPNPRYWHTHESRQQLSPRMPWAIALCLSLDSSLKSASFRIKRNCLANAYFIILLSSMLFL